MNNTIMRKIDVTAAYQAIVTERLVATVTVSCPPTNTDVVYFLGDDGSDVPFQPGQWETLKSVDLSSIQIKGTVGDTVTVVGGTW